MTLLRDPADHGRLRRFARIYREKRQPILVREYAHPHGPHMRIERRAPARWVCVQIAWHQSR